jgi:AraC-like DNA-binding protein
MILLCLKILTKIKLKYIIAVNIAKIKVIIAMFMENVALSYEPQRDVEQKLSTADLKNIYTHLHFHRSIELVYVHYGKAKVRCGQKTYFAEGGEIIFVPSYFAHKIDTVEENLCTNFIIPYNLYKSFHTEKIPLYYSLLPDVDYNKQIADIIMLAQKHIYGGNHLLAEGFSSVVLGLIVNRYRPEKIDKSDNEFVIKIIEYIDKNFGEEISLDKIAKDFNYSKYYFSKLFNKSFGCNLNHYINQVRCNFIESEKAKGGQKINDLILKAGFNDTSNYYKFLKKLQSAESGGI